MPHIWRFTQPSEIRANAVRLISIAYTFTELSTFGAEGAPLLRLGMIKSEMAGGADVDMAALAALAALAEDLAQSPSRVHISAVDKAKIRRT